MALFKLPSIASLHRGYARHMARTFTGSPASARSGSSLSQCDDTITPAPPVPEMPDVESPVDEYHSSHHLRQRHPARSRAQRPRSELLSSRRSSLDVDPHWQLDALCGGGSQEDETARLWQRMLELQRHFRCYNSARMDAAVEDEGLSAIVPPRSCLDLLNDSIAALPDEAQRELDAFLERLDGPARRKHRYSGGPLGIN